MTFEPDTVPLHSPRDLGIAIPKPLQISHNCTSLECYLACLLSCAADSSLYQHQPTQTAPVTIAWPHDSCLSCGLVSGQETQTRTQGRSDRPHEPSSGTSHTAWQELRHPRPTFYP